MATMMQHEYPADAQDISRTAWAIRLKIQELRDDYIFNNNPKFRNLTFKIDSNNVINVKIDAIRCCQRTTAISREPHGRFTSKLSSITETTSPTIPLDFVI